jgi:hypothetical protein
LKLRATLGLAVIGIILAVFHGSVTAHNDDGHNSLRTRPTRLAAAPEQHLLFERESDLEDDAILEAAVQVAIRRCMNTEGLTYYEATPRPLQLTDPARPGYGLAAEFRRRPFVEVERESAYEATLSPALRKRYDQALFGLETHRRSVRILDGTLTYATDGCVANARRLVFGNVDEYEFLTGQLGAISSETSARMIQSAEAQHLWAAWSKCMSRSHLQFRSAEEAALAAYRTLMDKGVTAFNERTLIHQAEADQRCQIATSYRIAIQRLRSNLTQLEQRQHGAVLSALLQMRRESLERIRRTPN